MDCDHTILEVNQTAATAAGRSKERCIGVKFWELFDNPGCRAEYLSGGPRHADRKGL